MRLLPMNRMDYGVDLPLAKDNRFALMVEVDRRLPKLK